MRISDWSSDVCSYDLARDPVARRGVGVADESFDEAQLAALRAGGIRGLRFTEIIGKDSGKRLAGASGFDTLRAIAPRMRAVGLPAQLFAPCDQIGRASWRGRGGQ